MLTWHKDLLTVENALLDRLETLQYDLETAKSDGVATTTFLEEDIERTDRLYQHYKTIRQSIPATS